MNPGWPERLKQQARDDTGRPWGNQKIAIFGTPDQGPCQCVITGFHLTLRATCARLSEVAFHGAICHGHQPSGFNERVGHPDNIFWYQAVLANRVYMALDEQQRQRALVRRGMPYYEFDGRIDRQIIYPDSKLRYALEPDVRFRGPGGTFPGLPIRDMVPDQKAVVRQALTGLLEPYRPEYREQVLRCLAGQGGLEACSMAFYQEHDLGNDGEWDNWLHRRTGVRLVFSWLPSCPCLDSRGRRSRHSRHVAFWLNEGVRQGSRGSDLSHHNARLLKLS